MDKRLQHIIEWTVAVAAYGYLIYRLATYDNYAAVAAGLRGMGWRQWLAMAGCVALMPLNMWLDAWKWRTLMAEGRDGRMSWREAQRQVYYSKLAGVVTPWRLGEYPARGVLMTESGTDVMPKVLSMGVIGSATMTAAIVIAGVTALAFSPAVLAQLGGSYLYALAAVSLVLLAAMALMPQWLKKWAEVNYPLLLTTLGQSLLRLGCWCVQLALTLYALNALGPADAGLSLMPVYYLLVTVTPNIPVVEAGVRGAWAMFLFGTPNAALAGILLWAVNTLLPCLCWPFIKRC